MKRAAILLFAVVLVPGLCPALVADMDQPREGPEAALRQRVVAILVDALRGHSDRVRVDAADSLLWNAYHEEEVRALFKAEEKTASGSHRIEVWRVLARADLRAHDDYVQRIRQVAADPHAPQRLLADDALERLGLPRVRSGGGAPGKDDEKTGKRPRSRSALRGLLERPDTGEDVRREICSDLSRTGDEHDLELLVSLLDDVDAGVRVASANAVLRIGRRQPHRMASVDWVVIALYAVVLLAIGWYYSRRTKSTEDYLLGGRRMKSLSVGLSLFASLMSTISYLAWPGEMIRYGPALVGMVLGYPLVAVIVGRLIIPAIMGLRITSAYEILETRLGPSVRVLGALFFLSLRLVWMAVIIYATTDTVLVPLLGLGEDAVALVCLVLGVITVIYTSMGGLRAVVVTDVVQTMILLGAALLTLVVISSEMGGVGAWWPTEWAPHWPEPTFGFGKRVGMLGTALASFTWYVCTAASDQIAIQRYLATRDAATARRALTISLVVDVIVGFVLAAVGLALVAYFRARPHLVPDGPGIFENSDRLFPGFIVLGLPAGVTGLVISGLLAAAMSSLSSGMNSSCSVVTIDFIDRWRTRKMSDEEHVRLAKRVSVVVGVVVVLLATLVGGVRGNLFEIAQKVVNLLTAPLAGLFFLALFVPRATATGAIVGAAASLMVVVCINFWEDIAGVRGVSFLWAMPLGVVAHLGVGFLVSLIPAGTKRKQQGAVGAG